MSRTARIGIALAKSMDRISESSEIVDAVFRALPQDVQDRWSAGRPDQRNMFGDQAGQYGVGGADWKLEALWHNWHKVDVPTAIANIIKNEAEDKLYGLAFGAMDSIRPRKARSLLKVKR